MREERRGGGGVVEWQGERKGEEREEDRREERSKERSKEWKGKERRWGGPYLSQRFVEPTEQYDVVTPHNHAVAGSGRRYVTHG
jgi:hypothetical protein